jgi:hypothetical protein
MNTLQRKTQLLTAYRFTALEDFDRGNFRLLRLDLLPLL